MPSNLAGMLGFNVQFCKTKFTHSYRKLCSGLGIFPDADPWGQPFSDSYHPNRKRLSGQRIAGPFRFVLDGVMGDADWIAHIFHLKRPLVSKSMFSIFECG